jgi:hypothetical protein
MEDPRVLHFLFLRGMRKSVRLLVSIIIMYKAFANDISAVAMVYSTSATLFMWSVVSVAYPLAG